MGLRTNNLKAFEAANDDLQDDPKDDLESCVAETEKDPETPRIWPDNQLGLTPPDL